MFWSILFLKERCYETCNNIEKTVDSTEIRDFQGSWASDTVADCRETCRRGAVRLRLSRNVRHRHIYPVASPLRPEKRRDHS